MLWSTTAAYYWGGGLGGEPWVQPTYRRLLACVVGAVGGVLLLVWLLPFILPFVIALTLAALIEKPVNAVERRLGVGRGLAVTLVLTVAMVVLVGSVAVVTANIATEIEQFYRRLPAYGEQWEAGLNRMLEEARVLAAYLPNPVDDLADGALEAGLQLLGTAATSLLALLQGVPNLFVVLLIAAMATFFFSRDKRSIAGLFLQLVPHHWHHRLFEAKNHVVEGILGLVKAQFILFTITTTLATTAFLAFGVRYAWVLGLLAGLLDLIPMLGPSMIFVPVVLHAALSGEGARALGLLLIWLALIILRQLLEPRILGAQVGLHPLSMLFALYFGVKLLGMNGVWLGPCVAIGMKAMYRVVMRPT